MKRFSFITIFPELIHVFRETGIVRRGCEHGIIAIDAINPRDFTNGNRGTVDDAPYGGGPGMVMQVQPVSDALAEARSRFDGETHTIYLSPQGRRFDQSAARELAQYQHLVLLAGRYEGIDERVIEREVDSEWSVGDFVVSGGEIPAMLIVESIVRTLPMALGDARSAEEDSFSAGLLDYPHYTRPEQVGDVAVPSVLLSGDHAAIRRWRRKQQLGRTWLRRPDLLALVELCLEDTNLLREFIREWRKNDSC
jgi:tRNA (guanine37-N1)-methyltransferase